MAAIGHHDASVMSLSGDTSAGWQMVSTPAVRSYEVGVRTASVSISAHLLTCNKAHLSFVVAVSLVQKSLLMKM